MKKIIAVIIALILVFAIMGCGKDDTTSAEQDTETVETTETVDEEAEPSEEAASGDESSDADSGWNS